VDDLADAVAGVAPGTWVVGVSGGADSVALLHTLIKFQPDVRPVVCHVNHQLRGDESDADESFVLDLARSLGLTCDIHRRKQPAGDEPTNPRPTADALRRLRLRSFDETVRRHQAIGVLLAHHADDQAETTLLRLLRGGEATSLAAMSPTKTIAGVLYQRPLLSVPRERLRRFLLSHNTTWREDSSNLSMTIPRNRVRAWLATRPQVSADLLALAAVAAQLKSTIPALDLADSFSASQLAGSAALIARAGARAWLIRRGVPIEDASADVCGRLIAMSSDAATPARQTFPGGVDVRRRRGQITASATPRPSA
jgi:tRNA(Ile)-lysidine synthetase-like protein